jgi:hypothetical protein
MEIKPAYPVAAPEKSPVVIAKKGRGRYGDFEVGNEARGFILPGKDVEDIVDITTEDIIHIDLTNPKSTRSPRDSSTVMYSLSADSKEKGTVIDIWA